MSQQTNDEAYAEGSIDACNAILAFLHRCDQALIATEIKAAWDGNYLVKPLDPPKAADTLLSPPKMDRSVAREQGFTGNSCIACGSMQMKVSGHCEVCSECGTTTGCS